MLNFIHEVPPPADPRMRAMLYWDYFHDSPVEQLTFERGVVEVRLWCQREHEDDLAGTKVCALFGVKRVGVPRTAGAKLENAWRPGAPGHENYLYTLRFEDCEQMWLDLEDLPSDLLNARFKDSPRLRAVIARTGQSHFHLRLQLFPGWIDVIYRRCQIIPHIGEVKVRTSRADAGLFTHPRRKYAGAPRTEVVRDLRSRSDFIREWALEELFRRRDRHVAVLAGNELRRALRRRELDPYDGALLAAVWILGRRGSPQLVPLLHRLWAYTFKSPPRGRLAWWYAELRPILEDAIGWAADRLGAAKLVTP